MLRFIVVTAVMAVHADVPDAAGHRLLASDWARAAAKSSNTTTTTPTAAAGDRRLDAVLPGVLYYTENYYADSRCTQLYFARTFVTNTCYYSGLGSVASTPTQTVYDYIQNTVTAVGNNDGYILRQAAFRDAACIVPDTSTGSPPYYAQTPITNTFAAVPRQCQVPPPPQPPLFNALCAVGDPFPLPAPQATDTGGSFPYMFIQGSVSNSPPASQGGISVSGYGAATCTGRCVFPSFCSGFADAFRARLLTHPSTSPHHEMGYYDTDRTTQHYTTRHEHSPVEMWYFAGTAAGTYYNGKATTCNGFFNGQCASMLTSSPCRDVPPRKTCDSHQGRLKTSFYFTSRVPLPRAAPSLTLSMSLSLSPGGVQSVGIAVYPPSYPVSAGNCAGTPTRSLAFPR